ncbi:MAG: threonine/serine exporter family protein [Eubacteriales bacterium]|nr:threonine/serine exporter family protein [Eubacteriales bacterium]
MEGILTTDNLLQLLMAFLGSAGFAVMFHLRRRFLLIASLGGLLSWLVYLLCVPVLSGGFFPALAASAFGAFYAEILARIKKAPSTLFFLVSMIPLIPGRTLYYSMSSAVDADLAMSSLYGLQTFQCALGIGAGMSVAWAICDLSRKVQLFRSGGRDLQNDRS